MAPITTDVCIIGGGLVGCFAGFFLRARGLTVVLVEKGEPGQAASGVNFGNLRLQGRSPCEYPLALLAHAIWETWSDRVGEPTGVDPCGHLYLAFSDADLARLEITAREAREGGVAVDLMTGGAARRRWPFLSALVQGACFSPRDAVADPRIATPTVVRAARRAGVDMRTRDAATAIARRGVDGLVVTTVGGVEIACRHVVDAAGAWAGRFAGALGEAVPMFPAGPPLYEFTCQPVYAGPSLHAVDGTLLLRPGDATTAVAGTFPRVPADLATGETAVPQASIDNGLVRLAAVVSGIDHPPVRRVWSGVEGYLPDMLPVLGASTTTAGVIHAFGFSGHGYQLAPGVGAVIADLIADGRSATPIDAFSVGRFRDGVMADDKLWSEFDPALVARFKAKG